MATKKQKEAQADTNLAFALIPFILAAIAFSLYHYAKLKAKYLTGPHTRRVFDMGTNWEAMLRSSVMAFAYAAMAWLLYQRAPWTMALSVPLGLVVLNWVGKVQAQAFLGVVVDYQKRFGLLSTELRESGHFRLSDRHASGSPVHHLGQRAAGGCATHHPPSRKESVSAWRLRVTAHQLHKQAQAG